jgi:hypothetical protein
VSDAAVTSRAHPASLGRALVAGAVCDSFLLVVFMLLASGIAATFERLGRSRRVGVRSVFTVLLVGVVVLLSVPHLWRMATLRGTR